MFCAASVRQCIVSDDGMEVSRRKSARRSLTRGKKYQNWRKMTNDTKRNGLANSLEAKIGLRRDDDHDDALSLPLPLLSDLFSREFALKQKKECLRNVDQTG